MGIGDRQALHAGAAGAPDAFFGIFDDQAFAGLNRCAGMAAGVQRDQGFEKNLRFRFSLGDVFSAHDGIEIGKQAGRI